MLVDYTDILIRHRVPPTLIKKPVLVDEDLLREYARDGLLFPYAFPGVIFRYCNGTALDDHPAKLRALMEEYPHITVLDQDPLSFPRAEYIFLEAPPERARDIIARAAVIGVKEIAGTLRESVGIHLMAEPGWKEYGPLTVLVQALYRVEAYRLPNSVFYPTPRGSMAEIRLKRCRKLDRAGEFYTFLKKAFRHRKKKLSVLFPGAPDVRVQDADPETFLDVFDSF